MSKLCSKCGLNPASVQMRQVINGVEKSLLLCNECATSSGVDYFGGGFGMNGFFDLFGDSMIGHGQPRFETNNTESIDISELLSKRGQETIELGAQIANEYCSAHLDTEHLLLALVRQKDKVVSEVFDHKKINTKELESYVTENIQKFDKKNNTSQVNISPKVKNVLLSAYRLADRANSGYIGPEHFLYGVLNEKEGLGYLLLSKFGLGPEEVADKIRSSSSGSGGNQKNVKSDTPTLDQFATDLSEKARVGKIDPVIGRNEEINRVVQILSRRTKNNPVLLGEPGVGKTAIAEGLALRMLQNKVSENLKGKRILALDLNSLIAGSKYRGEFEERIQKLLEEIKSQKGEIILFIDEIHTIVGAGSQEGQLDVANILKPALARGEIKAIGATTLAEYRKYIEKDSALERRFQPVMVSEPSVDEAIQIIRGIKDKFEAHHKVEISDAAIIAAVTLSKRYITDRFLPDKAIDLIDEAAAKVHMQVLNTPKELIDFDKQIKELKKEVESAVSVQDFKLAAELKKKIEEIEKEKLKAEEESKIDKARQNSVTDENDVREVLADWTKIPVTEMLQDDMQKYLELEAKLSEKVIGQEEACKVVADTIKRSKAGLNDEARPLGSFLFLGQTGVGKTELAKELANQIFGGRDNMIRLDMSEFMEKHSVSKIIGSPPGYVGFEEGGQLAEKVRRNPYCLILFDEVEKAHPDVLNLLLQILDDGHLTDSKGKKVNFKNCIIIATTNIAAKLKKTSDNKTLHKELMTFFRPEFLNRLDEIVQFNKLDINAMKEIVDEHIDKLATKLSHKGYEVDISEKAKEFIAKESFDEEFGARPLRRYLQKEIESKIADLILTNKTSKKKFKIGVSTKNGLKIELV